MYSAAFRGAVLRVLPPRGSLLVLANTQELALLLSCRQIHYEAHVLFYQLVEFRISTLDDLSAFYERLAVRYRPVIWTVAMWYPDFMRSRLEMWMLGRYDVRPTEQPFTNLKEVVIRGTPGHLLSRAWYRKVHQPPVFKETGRIDLIFR
jgi:hypothetical protein